MMLPSAGFTKYAGVPPDGQGPGGPLGSQFGISHGLTSVTLIGKSRPEALYASAVAVAFTVPRLVEPQIAHILEKNVGLVALATVTVTRGF